MTSARYVLPSGRRCTSDELNALVLRAIDDRIAEHQRAIKERGSDLGAPAGGLVLLAHGDSWFDYPCNSDSPAGGYSDTIFVLNGKFGEPHKMQVLSYAHYGAATLGYSVRDATHYSSSATTTADSVSGDYMLSRLKQAIGDKANGKFEALLLSTGGNDFAGNDRSGKEQFSQFLNDANVVNSDPKQALNDVFAARLKEVEAGFEKIVEFWKDELPGAPIFVNGYGNAIPNGHDVFGTGGWLRPGFIAKHWYISDSNNYSLSAAVVVELLTAFRRMVSAVAKRHDNVVLVDTASVLASNDWINELHPNPTGFAKVAQAFLRALRAWPSFAGRV